MIVDRHQEPSYAIPPSELQHWEKSEMKMVLGRPCPYSLDGLVVLTYDSI